MSKFDVVETRELLVDSLRYGAPITTKIKDGQVIVTSSYHRIDTENEASTDDVDYIIGFDPSQRRMLVRPAHDDRTIVLKHGTGNLICGGGGDVTLDAESDLADCFYDMELEKWIIFPADNTVTVIPPVTAGGILHYDFAVDASYTGTAGATVTTALGSATKAYSNLTAAFAQMVSDGGDKSLLICPGIYSERISATPPSNVNWDIQGFQSGETIWQASAGSQTLLNLGTMSAGTRVTIQNIDFDLAGQTSSVGITANNGTLIIDGCHISTGGASSSTGITATNTALLSVSKTLFTGSGKGIDPTLPQLIIVDDCKFACDTGIEVQGNRVQIGQTIFDCSTRDILIQDTGEVLVTGSQFNKGIRLAGSPSDNATIVGNTLRIGSGETGIDFSGLTVNSDGIVVSSNSFFGAGTAIGIGLDAQLTTGLIANNAFQGFTSGNEISGSAGASFQIFHNVSDAGALADVGSPVGHVTGGNTHVHDASVITYTPAVLTDWDGDADPGDVDNALDQLAERTDDLEAAPPSHDHGSHTGLGDPDHDEIADADGDTYVRTEQGANDNTIRIAAGGVSAMRATSAAGAALVTFDGNVSATLNLDVFRLLTADGPINITGTLSPAQITSDQNNYNPTNFDNETVIRLQSDASRNITGLVPAGNNDLKVLLNVGSFDIVLTDEDTASTDVNRFALNGDITLAPDHGAIVWYDDTTQRWRCWGVYTAGGGGAVAHDDLTELTDDDHTQYALLLGRSGGQTLIGGTGAGDDLVLKSTSNATEGEVQVAADHVFGCLNVVGNYIGSAGGATAMLTLLYPNLPTAANAIRVAADSGATTGISVTAVDTSPSLVTTANSTELIGIAGNAFLNVTSGSGGARTGLIMRGLNFVVAYSNNTSTATYTEITGARVAPNVLGVVTAAAVTIDNLNGFIATWAGAGLNDADVTITSAQQFYASHSGASSRSAAMYGFRSAMTSTTPTTSFPFYDVGISSTSDSFGNRFRSNTQFGSVTGAFGTGNGVIGIANATTNPSTNPAAGGVLYSNAGAGTWRGSGGTVTAFAAAGPHCGKCGADYWTVASINPIWKSWCYICGMCGSEYKGGPKSVLNSLSAQQKKEILRADMTWDEISKVMGVAA